MHLDTQSEVFWLNAANVALGLVVLVSVTAIVIAVARELWIRSRAHGRVAAEIDRDMKTMLGDRHVFADPQLGLTMADGGEPARDDQRDPRK